uniref:Uncharacterized protein n=1 Tax=Anguilla anguilla TaxID=7936 RepID=A0A0E9SQL7_ANGAN
MQQHGLPFTIRSESQAYVGIKTGDLQHVMMWGQPAAPRSILDRAYRIHALKLMYCQGSKQRKHFLRKI